MTHPDIPKSPGKKAVIAIIIQAGLWLYIKRAKHVIAPGMICFPGGSIEADESEQEALKREMQEELSVNVIGKEKLFTSKTSWEVEISFWLTEIISGEIEMNPLEIESYGWAIPEEIIQFENLLDSNYEFLNRIIEENKSS